MSIDDILSYLNAVHVRCTYGAVGEAMGVPAQSVGGLLGERRKEASWVVNARPERESSRKRPTSRGMVVALPLAPQLIVNSRMLYFCWVPEDPAAAAALLPDGLEPAENRAIFINQYVVDGDEQTSHFGAYSLTYAGLDLAGLDLEDGTPGRWWTHYLNSNPVMRDYAAMRGVPAVPGRTALTLEGDRLTATTFADDRPVIRSVARVGAGIADTARGHLRYITAVDGRLMSGNYAYVGELADGFELLSLEFPAPDHSCHALRPKSPLEVTFGFYAPRASFCYPGGDGPLNPD